MSDWVEEYFSDTDFELDAGLGETQAKLYSTLYSVDSTIHSKGDR